MRLTCALLALLAVVPLVAQPSDVGDVAFANSGKGEAQDSFLRALALLHNFEYERAAELFRKAQSIDPSFAMAYWGEAMTYTHPIWFQQDADAARAALKRLGATSEERMQKAPTERERDYLRTLDVLYGEGEKNARDVLYSDAMAALHAKYPDDVDATAFYALSILGTAHEGRDFATYMRAAALLEEVFPTHRRHPGVLHYLIHSYDDPIHAPLGMRAARLYGAVAPDAGHALHMTSHIFVALGMWDDVIDANRRAIAVVNQQRAAKSKPMADCGHYPIWLHYALLQKHATAEARKAFDACRAMAFAESLASVGPMDNPSVRLGSWVEMRAQMIAGGLPLLNTDLVSLPASSSKTARLLYVYTDALAAAQRGDAKALKSAAEMIHTLTGDAKDANDRIREQVMVQEVDALLLLAQGRRDDALKLLEAAAKAEQGMPFEFGPPVVPKPATELLGEQLLAAGRATEAAAALRAALARTPGRTVTMEALERAQKPAH